MRRIAPSWLYTSAFALAAIAGSVNAVAWLGSEHAGITHVTGALTEASTRGAQLQFTNAASSMAVVAAFLFGALLSGLLIRDESLQMGRHYGIGLVLEGVLLATAFIAREHRYLLVADCFAACACGLQNALATNFSGAVLRTTHMTGVVTDLGLLLGHTASGKPLDWWRLWLYLSLLGGFIAGGALGAIADLQLGATALLLPAAAVTVAGLGYSAWIGRRGFGHPMPKRRS